MVERTSLLGMTWDHPRGFDPMVATAKAFGQLHPEVEIIWEKRSLQAFADRPIGEMANIYDLMVIDHPHVGGAAYGGGLLALNKMGRQAELDEMAANSTGCSYPSYEIDGHQWALPIDAATPVAAFRHDLLPEAPRKWDEVLRLAKQGRLALALIPVNALMGFFGLAKNMGFAVAEEPDLLIRRSEGLQILELMKEITALVDPKCLELDPIGILDWMGNCVDGPAYCPFGYGYTNYSRAGYCRFPITFADAPGIGENGPRGTVIGGTGIAVSAMSKHKEIAVDYAFWLASAKVQEGLFFDAGGQPAHRAAWESEKCNKAARNFFYNTRQTMESAWLRPRYNGYMGFQARGGELVNACLKKEISVKAALERMQASYVESRL